MSNNKKTYLIYKPYMMLSQFTQEVANQVTLKDLDYTFEKDIYPVGRLDADSEGLLVLSNDKTLTDKLLNPKNKHWRTYYVQVEGAITQEAIAALCKGVEIKANKNQPPYLTQPAKVEFLQAEDIAFLPERNPPVRFRANIPTSWLSISLIEGKNRQVRKMTAAVGFPTLRLVRVAIGAWQLKNNAINPNSAKLCTTEEIALFFK